MQYVQDYLSGGIEYRQNGTGVKRVEAVNHAEGRYYNTNVDASNTISWRREYNIKDHLGNTRLVFTDRNANGVVDITGTASTSDVLQENHYYAFGLPFEGAWLQNDAAARDNKYQYNGKEFNDDFGLNWNDYGARWYDAGIGRWNGVDLLAAKFDQYSVYVFALNNPIRFVDPNGMDIISVNGGIQFTGDDARRFFEQFQARQKVQVYIVNSTSNGILTASDNEVQKAMGYANDIFKKNGFSFLQFNLISKAEAKKKKLRYDDLFLEIRSFVSSFDGGFSMMTSGMTETYLDGKETSPSYANYGFDKIQNNNNPIYALGYLIAHELLHQLLVKSQLKYTNTYHATNKYISKTDPFHGSDLYHSRKEHLNDFPNLNQDGTLVTIPSGASQGLQPAERIDGERHFIIWWHFIFKQKY